MATAPGRETLLLLALVLALDAVFVAIYLVGNVRSASDPAKVVFTAVWTLAILVIALRGLSRIRSARLHKPLD
ncbi:MAG: hypothetical protein QOK27_840 [Gemmatimonadales bacterium]|nr:hypothetical protein [Gemmatimonadales bacterium]